MSIDARLAVLAGLPRRAFDFTAFTEDLSSRLDRVMKNLTGDPERDLVSLKDLLTGLSWDLRGIAPAGHVRLFFSVRNYGASEVEATVLAAKGDVEVDADALGESGELYGNRVHIVRGFDILLETAIEHGVTQIVGKPVDERVRGLYVLMGFRDGEVLDLYYERGVERAVIWIDTNYRDSAAKFAHFERPW